MIRRASEQPVEIRRSMRGGIGEVTVSHFFKPGECAAPVRLCARLTIPPGASIGTHEHVDEDEFYIVARGTGVLRDGEHEQRVSCGDAVLTGSGGRHSISNDGNEPLELIAVIVLYGR
jgi:mannose-6-phosphate isomerase-like protein (cupin superfamily)